MRPARSRHPDGLRWRPSGVAATVLLGLALCFVLPHLAALLAPAVLLLVPLILGRYPGERALVALRAARSRVRVRPDAPVDSGRRAVASAPRGGRLVAQSLAGRAPPLAVQR